MLEAVAVLAQLPPEVVSNRPCRMRALVLALDVVAVPNERFQLFSALALDCRGRSFAPATARIIGTKP